MGSAGFNVKQAIVLGSGMGLRVVALLVLAVLAAGPAQAVPFIPFDAEDQPDGFSYGFVYTPEAYPEIDTLKEISGFYQAAEEGTPAALNSVLVIDPDGIGCHTLSGAVCDRDNHIIDVEWLVTFNADPLDDPTLVYDVDLLLVDSSIDSIFDDLVVTIDYASATLDGSALDFQTAHLNTTGNDNYFVDLVLGPMRDGETRRVGFSYNIEGRLDDFSDDEPALLIPVILPGAFATPVPEPGTASLLGLGLAALAFRRRRA